MPGLTANSRTHTACPAKARQYIKYGMERLGLPLAAWLDLAHEVDEFLAEAPADPAERAAAAAVRFGAALTPEQAASASSHDWLGWLMQQLG